MATYKSMVVIAIGTIAIAVSLLFSNNLQELIFFIGLSVFCMQLATVSVLSSILKVLKEYINQ